jgi:hypothetical protein
MSLFYEGPILPINQGSLHAIDIVITGYLSILMSKDPVPLDAIQKFESLRLKLAPLLVQGGCPIGTILPLSLEEFQLFDEALRGFIEAMLCVVAPSTTREAMLRELQVLQKHVQSCFKGNMN